MKKNIFFVSQEIENKQVCGNGTQGTTYGQTLVKSKKYNIKHIYCDSFGKLYNYAQVYKPEVIFYNFHINTLTWVLHPELKKIKAKHVLVYHDSNQTVADEFCPEKWYGFEYMVVPDLTIKPKNKNFFTTCRLIPPYVPSNEYVDNGKVIIGFHGQLIPAKGLDHLAMKVQEEFDSAVINLHCPNYQYGDGKKVWDSTFNNLKNAIYKPNIEIVLNTKIVNENELIDILSQNTINCYFYKYVDGAGIASSPDFALAAKRPMCLTKSYMFRNFWDTEDIFIENNSIKNIIKNGIEPLQKYYDLYSERNFLSSYENIIDTLIN